MKNEIFPHTFWRPFLDCVPQLFVRPKYVWIPVHLKGPMIPDPSGQLAELIVYITSTRVDLYSHQILLPQPRWEPWLGGYVLDKWLTTFVTVWNLKWFGSSVTLSQDHQHVNNKIESIYINYEKFEGNGGSYGTGPKTICHPVSQGD